MSFLKSLSTAQAELLNSILCKTWDTADHPIVDHKNDLNTGTKKSESVELTSKRERIFGSNKINTTSNNQSDYLEGKQGPDFLDGGNGDDSLYGRSGPDELIGGNGKDAIAGESGRDTLTGGGGNDVLFGGNGLDTYTGGGGRDIFVLALPSGNHHGTPNSGNEITDETDFLQEQSENSREIKADTITDFQKGVDLIALADGINPNSTSLELLEVIVNGTFATVISYENKQIGIIENIHPSQLTASNFISCANFDLA